MIRLIISFLICYFYVCYEVAAQPKFECDGSSFISVIDGGQTSFYALTLSDIGAQQSIIAEPFDARINAIGYNPKDSLIYGIDTQVNRLYRVWADGTIEGLQFIQLQGDYFAGDIHPSGDRLVLLNSDSIAFIFLDEMEIPVEYVAINTLDSTGIFTTDIAYHPITHELFGYDGLHGKLISINDSTGLVDNMRYPSINFNDGLPALFFDPRGELYGIGNNNSNQESILFKFDLDTGLPSTSAINSPMGDRDGCSCPFTVKLFQKVNNTLLAPCSDMEVVLTISNLTSQVLTDYTLFEDFPDGYIINEIVHNPFSGDLTSGVGSDRLEMVGMEIPSGVDSIKLIVTVPESTGGEEHSIQAQLTGNASDPSIDNTLLSNDLLTSQRNSPTLIRVEAVEDIFSAIIPDLVELCVRDTFRLSLPSSNDFEYEWSDGIDTLDRSFYESEEISLDVITACKRETFDISIQETEFDISLGEDLFIEQNEIVILQPDISSISPVDSFIWTTLAGDANCSKCTSLQVQAKGDIKYNLVVRNESGCFAADAINLFVNRNIYTPNAFSPNGDGINDYFYFVSGFPNVEIKEMKIFDRWGANVFTAENLTTNQEIRGWDGHTRSKIANAGNYFWTATIVVGDGREKQISGSLVLQK